MRNTLFILLLFPFVVFGQGNVRTFDTVEQMTNATLTSVATGDKSTVAVRGLSSLAGGMFYLALTDTNAVDNITYFPQPNGGRWIRLSDWIDGGAGSNQTNSTTQPGILPTQVINSFWMNEAWRDLTGIFLDGTNTTVTITNGTVAYNSTGGGSGGSTVYVFGSEYPHLNFIDDPTAQEVMRVGIFGTTNLYSYIDWDQMTNHILAGANMTVSLVGDALVLESLGGAGGTNGTPVTVNGGADLVRANFQDGPNVKFTLAGTNITATVITNSLTTNEIDTTFYTLLTQTNSGSSTGSVVRVNAGSAIPDASLDSSSFISFAQSGGSITAAVVAASLRTNEISPTFYSWIDSHGGGGGSGTNLFLNDVLLQPAKLTNSPSLTGGLVWLTNAAGDFYGYATNISGVGTGAVVRVNAGASIPDASFDSSSFISFANSSGSITAGVVSASLRTNEISPAFYNWIDSHGGSGGGGLGTNAFVNGLLTQPLMLTNAAALAGGVVWLTNANGSTTAYATNITVSGGTNVGSLLQVLGGAYLYLTNVSAGSTSAELAFNSMFGIITNIIVTGGGTSDKAHITMSLSPGLTDTNYQVMFTSHGNQGDGIPVSSIEHTFQGTNEVRFVVAYSANSGAPNELKLNFWIVDYNASANIIGSGTISDTAFAPSWDGSTTVAPSQNAVYDWGTTLQATNAALTALAANPSMYQATNANLTTLAGASITGTNNFMRTRTGVPRYLIMDSSYFQPEATEPATASTNQWATTTDRTAKASWDFSPTSTNGVFAPFAFPMEWNSGTLNVKVYWKQVVAEASTTNVWQAAIGSLGDNETGGAVLGTAVTVLDEGLNDTNKLAITSWSSAITPGNTGAPGDGGMLSIRRLPGNTSDNMTVTTRLLGVLLEYTESTTEPTDN